VPLVMARLKGPKKILRLGGDFFWERYTDQGGMKSLRDWYSSTHYSLLTTHWLMQRLLRAFDHVAFSTRFQEGICEKHCRALPLHSVIENALPEGSKTTHHRHEPFRLLFMGRFVGFKNLPALLEAVSALDGVTLTLVGDGPMKIALQRQPVGALHATPLREKVVFLSPAHGDEKQCIFSDHDLLVLPSITEISPNVALEARAVGLPVLLTKETGLSERLREGMVVRDLSLPGKIADAIREVMQNYERVAEDAAQDPPGRGWGEVVEEWLSLMS
jgi:glycosyltransferase involved in cell wall biosynthesis